MGYFTDVADQFRLGSFGDAPLREAQIGALHAVIAHFTVHDTPAIVALPTGVGKTAVANAIPYALRTEGRVLVVEPSVVLRKQAAQEFRTLDRLRQVRVVEEMADEPVVYEQDSRTVDAEATLAADIIVGHPNSLVANDEFTFPPDFFSLVIFDEGHHLAAPTWDALLEHFSSAQAVALTATPFRRDRKRVPGRLIYDYPLTRAAEKGAYRPVTMVPVPNAGLIENDAARDAAIRDKVLDRYTAAEHDGSGLLIRAGSIARARELAELYASSEIRLAVVHSGLAPSTIEKRLDGVTTGVYDGAAFVGLLGEGFDCPRLKIGAYHDKHKSLPATLQFIGRLTRTTDETNGPAEVVTTYEMLRGDTWALYRHDAVWELLIPQMVANATEGVQRRGELFADLPDLDLGDLTLHDIEIRRQAALFEVDKPMDVDDEPGERDWWDAPFIEDRLEELRLVRGEVFANGQIVWVGTFQPDQAGAPFLAIITEHVTRPRWARSQALDAATYEIHTATAVTTAEDVRLLLVTANTRPNERQLAAILTSVDSPRRASAQLTGSYLSNVEYESVHGLGQRNAAAGGGGLSYSMLTGKGVDGAITDLDTQGKTLGHVFGSGTVGDRVANVGASPDNGRIWENSTCHLNDYVSWAVEIAAVLTEDGLDAISRLPQVATAKSLDGWPAAAPLLVEPNASTYERLRVTEDFHPSDLQFDAEHSTVTDGNLRVTCHYNGTLVFDSEYSNKGALLQPSVDEFVPTLDGLSRLSDELEASPPTIHFADLSSVRGTAIARDKTNARPPRRDIFTSWDWTGVDIRAEARARDNAQSTIHERVVEFLGERVAGRGWLLTDDGSNELADHVAIIPSDDGAIDVHLYHSKFSTEDAAGVRAADLDVVVQQALRSRRFINNRSLFWREVARRLRVRASTEVLSVDPHDRESLLEHLERWSHENPLLRPTFVIVQPGFAVDRFFSRLEGIDEDRPPAALINTFSAAEALLARENGTFHVVGSEVES